MIVRHKTRRDAILQAPWNPAPNVATCTVSCSSPIPNDGATPCAVTITLLDSVGNPIAGYQPGTLSVTGQTTNSLTQPGVTDTNGRATGFFTSTDSGGTATAHVAGLTATGTCTVNGSGGSALVLNGSGFGTKATAAPLYFSTFENSTLGVGPTDVTVGLEVVSDNPKTLPTIVNDKAHSGTKSLCMVYPQNSGSVGSSFPGIGKTIASGAGATDFYSGQWVYWAWTVGTVQSSFIFKWGRGGAGQHYHGTPQFHCTIRPSSSGTVPSTDSGYTRPDGTDIHDNTINSQPTRDGWHWVEYKYRLSTPGVADGKYQWLCDGVVNSNLTSAMTRESTDTSTLTWVMGTMDGNDTYGLTNEYRLWNDEMLLDTTFARVIITDNTTYASSTKWAPQSCSAWSNTQITIPTPNYSTLASGTAYAHVFDANDNHVTSIAVTVP